MTKIKLVHKAPQQIVDMAYPIHLLKTKLNEVTNKKKFCENADHSKATDEQKEIVNNFLQSVPLQISSLKKAIKLLER